VQQRLGSVDLVRQWVSMRSILPLFALCTLACLSLATAASAAEVQAWNMFLLSGPVKDRLVTWTEVQPRLLLDDNGRLGQFLVRQAVGIRLHDNVDLMLGVHWQRNTTAPDTTIRETRIYQHVAGHLLTTRKGLDLQGQFRLEQRMFLGEPDTIWRTRLQLHLYVPLRGPGTIGPVIASETMYNLNGGNGRSRSGFEQQRTSVGLYAPLGKGFSLEATYLNQRLARIGPDRTIHVANLKLSYKLGKAGHGHGHGHDLPDPADLHLPEPPSGVLQP
jgi:hypothetical protein